MAREKKDALPLHVRIDAGLMAQLDAYCREVGWTKTTAIERMLKSFLQEQNPMVPELKKNN